MQVTIESKEVTVKPPGFFSKPQQGYQILTTVDFSEIELAIIKARKLEALVLWAGEPYRIPGTETVIQMTLDVKKLINERPYLRGFPTVVEAKRWDDKMRTEILPLLKNHIQASETINAKDTFEL